jgi:hypothetical protein
LNNHFPSPSPCRKPAGGSGAFNSILLENPAETVINPFTLVQHDISTALQTHYASQTKPGFETQEPGRIRPGSYAIPGKPLKLYF